MGRVKIILISIIIPILNNTEKHSLLALDCILEQAGNLEVIVVAGTQVDYSPDPAKNRVKVISCSAVTRGALLNAGAEAAQGDILLFLWPDSQLPPGAMVAIEHNFQILPQTIGGNFHVKFDDNSRYTRLLTRFLKRWRYDGRYYGNSGIFVRREVHEALGGFQSHKILEDYEFARRMEMYGPTLYLPNAVTASVRKFKNSKLKATFNWLVLQSLFMLGVPSDKLDSLWNRD